MGSEQLKYGRSSSWVLLALGNPTGHEKLTEHAGASLASGEATRVHVLDSAVGKDERQVAERVKDGVGHGGEEREGAGGNGGVELQPREDDVGGQRAPDSNPEAQLVVALLLLGLGAVLVHRLEHPFDGGVLVLVEPPYLARAALWAVLA